MSQQTSRLKVLISGICSLILTVGIARFAYTPMLVVMQSETWLDDVSGGWLATYNYIGYFLGALLATTISDLKLKDTIYRIGLILAVITTAAMAFTENMLLWSVLRFFAGLGSAAGLLIGSGLLLNWLMRHNHRSELGIHFSGLGLGIAISTLILHLLENNFNWSEQWFVLSILGLMLFIPAWFWLPRPEQVSLKTTDKQLVDSPPSKQFLYLMLAAYFCAGVGYVVSATFIVAIVERQPSLQGQGWLAFFIVGLAATPACIIWDRLARKIGTMNSLFIAYCLLTVSIIWPLFQESLFSVLFCAGLYGATMIGIVSLVLTMAGRFYPTKPAKLMGKLTLSYGLAQIGAPAISGMIAQSTGSYNYALIMATLIMVVGTIIIYYLRSFPEQI